jgi:short subunit fatty acids transporter
MKAVFYFIVALIGAALMAHAATSTGVEAPSLPAYEGVFNPVTMIATASMIISLVSCFWMMLGQRKSASTEYVRQIEKRLKDTEAEVKILKNEVAQLTRENIELLRRLAQVPPS